jgi:NADH-quinone oxidoreductase subunit N
MAGLMLCAMFSLAGIPPFLGFWAKLAVLGATIHGGLLWLAILGVISAVMGCFYYLRVVKVMYFDEPVGEPLPRHNDRVLGIVLGVNCVGLLVLPLGLGVMAEWVRTAFTHLS